jgi:hypothetical protein
VQKLVIQMNNLHNTLPLKEQLPIGLGNDDESAESWITEHLREQCFVK